MKKLLIEFIFVLFLFLGLQWIIQHFQGGKEISYEMSANDRKYKIKEIYTKNETGNENGYYFEIKSDQTTYVFQTSVSFRNKQNLINKIYEYRGNDVSCILPVLNGKVVTDFICNIENSQYYYHNIAGKYEKLDQYVDTVTDVYQKSQFQDQKKRAVKSGASTIYPHALMDTYGVMVSTYRGVSSFNDKLKSKTLFESDVYEQKINTMIGHYYLVADYEQPFEIDRFYLVDLINNKKEVIETKYMISKDSYIQGIVENSVYLYDRANQKQYEINIKEKSISEVGNPTLKTKYYDGMKWGTKEMYDIATTDIYFQTHPDLTTKYSEYEKVIQVGGNKTGYLYYYQKDDTGYQVYRAPVRNPKKTTYLFHTTLLSKIEYLNDSVYYLDHNDVKCFDDFFGIQTVMSNTELEFNPTISYGIYTTTTVQWTVVV